MRPILASAVSIGPLTVPGWLLLYIVALAVSAGFARLVKAPESGRTVDLVLNAGTIWLLAWKLTPVLLRPGVAIRDPMSVLATPGGTAGVLVGLAAALAYAIASLLRNAPTRSLFVHVGATMASGAIAFFLGIAVLGIVLGGQETRTAPPFTLDEIQGGDISLEQYAGRTVILNFWATWCPPCRAEIPDLIDFHEASGEVVLLSVNQTSSERGVEPVRRFSEELGIEYPVALDRSGIVSAAYGVRGIPTTFVIDPDGTITERAFGAVSAGWLRRFLR